jgi:hypothetical protein
MSGVLNLLLAGAASAIKDAYFNLTTLLLNTSSTNGAQNNTFLDSSTNNFTITRNGNTTQGTFTPFSQTGWSNFFNTGYLTVASNAAFDFGSGDATIEAWIYPTTSSQTCGIFDKRSSGGNYSQFPQIALNSGALTILVSYNGSSWAVTINGATPAVNAWSHIALVRNGNIWTLYVNGSSSGTPVTASGSVYASTDSLSIGASTSGGTNPFAGYISNARLVKGSAVYTGAFTPPTAALTAITNTSLLTCQSNRFLDNSTNAFTVTPNGTYSVQAFSPFVPTDAYSTSVVGGSGYFEGSGDYLTWTGSTVGTAAYTFECWFYTPSFGSSQTLIGPNSTSNGGYGFNIASSTSLSIDNYGIAANNFTVPTIAANAWNHVAVVRNGSGVTTVFLNGVRSSTGTITDNNNYGDVKSIGYTSSGVNRYFNGYISNPRYVTSAVYDPTQTTITVPTAPLTAITNTQLLLSATNAGIYDSAAKNDLETVGNAQVSTTQAKFGTTSMAFDGTGDYLTIPNSPTIAVGSGDFAIECWWYPTDLSASSNVWCLGDSRSANNGLLLYWSSGSGKLILYSNGSALITSSINTTTNAWYYINVVRSGSGSNNLTLYINGSSAGTATNTTSFAGVAANGFAVCAEYAGSFGAGKAAYFDDVRITKGYARPSTSPTAAFPLQ